MLPPLSSEQVSRIHRDVERSVLRARNGIRFVTGASRPRVGATPKDVVWRRDRAELWRYRGGAIRYGQPLLFVHSLVSRSYILDLRPGNSTVEFFVDQGFDVFMLDWGVPDERDGDNSLETYVDEYLPRAVAALQQETGCDEITIAGYCLGGVFAILYAAGYADAPIRNLVPMATPVDFGEMGVMVAALLEGRLETDELLDETGNVPADVLYRGFFMQAPTTEVARYATLLENLWNDTFVEGWQAMAQWSRDHVPFPGAVCRQIVDEFIRRNALMTGHVRVGGRVIHLENARGNLLNCFAERDNVVPAAASEPIVRLVGEPSRREELRLGGGHVTFATGRQAFERTLPAIAGWIGEHSDELTTPRER